MDIKELLSEAKTGRGQAVIAQSAMLYNAFANKHPKEK